jgi:hypothetical protein
LIGPRRLEDAARRFVHDHPPTAPCIAEYGRQFPAFLAAWPETAPHTYVPQFADLDWHLGRLAVSIEEPALRREQLAGDVSGLLNARVTLQPGTQYVHAGWPIDALITMYLSDSAPESWTLVDEEVRLEARGDRGSFRLMRLTAEDYAFRASLSAGSWILRSALGSLDGVGYERRRIWGLTCRHLWTVEDLLAEQMGGGTAARRLASLSATRRVKCASRVQARLKEFTHSELTDRPEVPFAVAHPAGLNAGAAVQTLKGRALCAGALF